MFREMFRELKKLQSDGVINRRPEMGTREQHWLQGSLARQSQG